MLAKPSKKTRSLALFNGLLGFFLLVLGPFSLAQAVSIGDTQQNSYGDCSPVVKDTGGNVTIHCQGLSEKEATRLLVIVSEALRGFDSLETIAQQTRMLDNLLDQVDGQKLEIAELESTIEVLAEHVRGLLSDDAISDDVKVLISEGKIEAAEDLVDSYAEALEKQDEQLAAKHYERGRVKELRVNYAEALKSFEKAVVLQPENSIYLTAAGSVNQTLGRYGTAISFFNQALNIDLEVYGEDHPYVAIDQSNLASSYIEIGEYENAIEKLELALNSMRKTYENDFPEMAAFLNNLGFVYSTLGEWDKALRYYQMALDIDLKFYGKDHAEVASDHSNIGTAYTGLGQHSKAFPHLELALASHLNTYGEDHPNVAIARSNLGSLYSALGQYDKAVAQFKLSLAAAFKVHGENHPSVAIRHNNLGAVYTSIGEYAKAIEHLELALINDLKFYGEGHLNVAIDHHNLGQAYFLQLDYTQAIKYFKLSLTTYILRLGHDHPNTQMVKKSIMLAESEMEESK